MHTCPVKHCEVEVEDDRLMCKMHWFQLTFDERHEVYDSYRELGPGSEHIARISPVLKALNDRLYPPRNMGKPFGL